MKRTILATVLVALVALVASPARAQSAGTATVTVLHGVPDLTVDVYANGDVLIPGFKPGDQFGPADLPAGRYSIAVRAAGAAADSAPAIAADIDVPAGANATAIAHLDAAGTPKLSVFVNDVSPLDAGQARVTVRHTAAFGAVDVLAADDAVLEGVTNPQEGTIEVPGGTYPISVTAAGDRATRAFSGDVSFEAGTAYFVHAIGDPAKGSFDLLVQAVAGLDAEVLGVATGSGGLRSEGASAPGVLLLAGGALALATAVATGNRVAARRR